jgi:NAD-dependent DNA ligase
VGWFDELLRNTPPERRESLRRAAGRERPNTVEAGPKNLGRAGAAHRRIATRNMDELIGMCRMILSDGAIDDSEARVLLDWLERSYQAVQEWPGNVLYQRIIDAMIDGKIDSEEESELLDVIHRITGGAPTEEGPRVSGAIPYDEPAPQIEFASRKFVVTGQFVFGSRKKVSQTIEDRGGAIAKGCSKKTNYLVVGTFGSDEWLHSTHGTKIVKAVELRKSGTGPAIVSERHWTTFI